MVEQVHQVLLEGVTVLGHGWQAPVIRQQRGVVVHDGRPIAWLQEDDWCAHARLWLQQVQHAFRLPARTIDHAFGKGGTAAVGEG